MEVVVLGKIDLDSILEEKPKSIDKRLAELSGRINAARMKAEEIYDSAEGSYSFFEYYDYLSAVKEAEILELEYEMLTKK